MTVAELLATLQTLPPSAKVYTARDEEGNGFADVIEVSATSRRESAIVIWPSHAEIHYDELPS